MKKIILLFAFTASVLSLFAQSEKYVNAMQSKLVAMDSTRDAASLKDLSAAFERIGDAEKNQWQPYYYAALTQVNSGIYQLAGKTNGGATELADPIADKADQLLTKAEGLSKDNSEIFLVKKMIATLRMMADPMNRYMTYGPQAQQALETAKKLNPENPRIYLLEGQDKFYTPEQFGGSKTEAKKLFELALQKFASFKPVTPLDPSWGKGMTDYFLSQVNQ